ncbi:MAG: hypothetical protein QXK12_03750 [Candidatus Nezhaarchaeales archaeon]
MLQGAIKPEVRILVVSALTLSRSPLRAFFLFLVLRGRLWIEGVFTANARGTLTLTLAKAIVKSRYYKELRFILLDSLLLKPPFSIDPVKIATTTGLPVLVLISGSVISTMADVNRQLLKLTVKSGKHAYIAYYGVDEARVNAFVNLVRVGMTLEPLRMFNLLRRALTALKPHLKRLLEDLEIVGVESYEHNTSMPKLQEPPIP